MSKLTTTEVVDPHTLSPAENAALIEGLYAVHCEVFDGVSRESFAAYVVNSKADETSIQLFRDPEGQLAGYVATHTFLRHVDGQPVTVVRAEAGLRRSIRGGNAVGSFMARQILAARARHSGVLYYLGCLVHPSSYCAFANYAAEIWPHPERATPPEIEALMLRLGDEFGLQQVDPARPLVRDVGWITRDTEGERRWWLESGREDARFYIEQNPGFVQGNGLLTLVPISAQSLAMGLASLGFSRLHRNAQHTLSAVSELLGGATLSEEELAQILARSSAFRGVGSEVVAEIARAGQLRTLAARTVLFREGDAADSLYVIRSGGLRISVEDRGEKRVLDQLGPGQIVGELALLGGQPRSATVQAATETQVLEIRRAALMEVLEEHPEVLEHFHRNSAARVLEIVCRYLPRLRELEPSARQAWVDEGAIVALGAGDSAVIDPGDLLFVFQGALVLRGVDQSVISAPSLLPVRDACVVHAPRTCRFALLPPR